jgi:transcriptional regulator of acetoin/glycerol metabolism
LDAISNLRHFPHRIRTGDADGGREGFPGAVHEGEATQESLREAAQTASEGAEKAMIEKVLQNCGGNRTLAAQRLGVSRKTLFNKMKALRIS